jgi:hypothetical protein
MSSADYRRMNDAFRNGSINCSFRRSARGRPSPERRNKQGLGRFGAVHAQ